MPKRSGLNFVAGSKNLGLTVNVESCAPIPSLNNSIKNKINNGLMFSLLGFTVLPAVKNLKNFNIIIA
jgi:hypothetical protein